VLKYLKYDFSAGIVVFLIAIPLCLGIALASGAPLFSGIISGFIGGIVVGSISGSKISVSGPAAGMVAVVLAAITQLGGFEMFLLALLFAGILQIIIGVLRVGFIVKYIPSNVIQGLLCAIGILIIVKQLPFAFSYANDHLNVGAIILSIISICLLTFFKKIPGPIIVVLVGVVLNGLYIRYFPSLIQYSDNLVNIPISDNIQSFLKQFDHPDWLGLYNPKVYLYAVMLCAVASIEALLNLEAIEKIHNTHQNVSANRELVAQGVGNTLAAILGGIPITSVVVRGTVNIQAGAKSRASTIFHGIFILFAVIFIPRWINLIPLASLAAILIYVGYKLTKPYIYREIYSQGLAEFIPFVVTIVTIIFSNLLTGVLVGLFLNFVYPARWQQSESI